MDIIGDIINSIEGDASVQEVRIGAFWTAVVSRGCGLASTLVPGGNHHLNPPLKEAGRLVDKSALELARLADSPNTMEAGIGMAAINSLIQVDVGRCVELNAADFLVERGKGKRMTLVGHFPFVPRLRQAAGDLSVIEKRPQEGDLGERQAVEAISQADVVAITGSAFINGTMGHLLELTRPDSLVMVLGPTSPMSPVLFDYGVDVVSGTQVVDTATVLRYMSEGATFRQMEGVRLLTMIKEEMI